MNHIDVTSFAHELNLDENDVYKVILDTLQDESKKKEKKQFLVDEERKHLYIFDYKDLDIIRDGHRLHVSFSALAEHFKVDFGTLNWLLDKLVEAKLINEATLKYYREAREKPGFKVYYEPENVSVGEEVALVIEMDTVEEIEQPKIFVNLPEDVEIRYKPILPEKIIPGRRIDKLQLSGLKHGNYTPVIKFEGIIQGGKFEERLTTSPLVIKALPPKLRIEKLPISNKIAATYNRNLELKFRIINMGRGEAQNARIIGIDKHQEVRTISGVEVGIVTVHGRIDHPIILRPMKSGNFLFDDLILHYEDNNGNKFSENISPFSLEVNTSKPELKIDIDTIPIVDPGDIFTLTLRISNIGQGEARNVKFRIPITPSSAKYGVQEEYRRSSLGVHISDEVRLQLKAPEEGEVTLGNVEISFTDEEGNSLSYDFMGLKIPVKKGKITNPVILEWPFKVDEPIGKYQILEEIGEGGFSKVYLVEDKVMRQKKALKALKSTFVIDSIMVEDFIEEARNAIRLRSPNIVNVYDADKIDFAGQSFPYIIMEYISGGTLQDKLVPGKPMDIVEACCVIQDICFALISAHQQKYIHCDIKPSNIFFDNDNAIWKLGDFGLAKIMRGKEALSSGGSPVYMPPEAREEEHIVNEKSDIYMLGCVFKEMLTGNPRGSLRNIKETNENIDQSIQNRIIDVIERMTIINPQERPELNEIIKTIRLSTIRGHH